MSIISLLDGAVEIDHITMTSEMRRTVVRAEMTGPVGVRPTTRRNVGNTSPENDAWSKHELSDLQMELKAALVDLGHGL